MRGSLAAAIVCGLTLTTSTAGPAQVSGYDSRATASIWIDAAGHPTPDAVEALALLRNAAADGLDPADYHSAMLDGLAAALEAAPSNQGVAAFDAALSTGVVRYFRHLHAGRVDPRAAGFRIAVSPDDHDFAAIVRAAVAGHHLAQAVEEFTPPLPLYRDLRNMLARYRSLAADPALAVPLVFTGTVKPGNTYAGLAELHRRLLAFGDVASDVPVPREPNVYEGPLVAGVKHFQIRHALEPDGILGAETQAALRVPVAARVRQIELALERLRWLPHLGDERFVAVNIPMFRLWAWDSIPPDGAPSFDMGVIVGRALNTQTPVFVEEMESVIFRPYWNVPPSILRNETLPAIARDPDYLRRQDMEIVSGPGDDARPVAATSDSIAQLRQGRLRVRQRPGPNNALGLVKFVFPNDQNIYMHGTPAMELFSRSRRDFSHGCVRLEDALALAEWVLNDQPEWTRERILAAMNGTTSLRVDLRKPIQVILFYVTAVVMPEDDTLRFAPDIYGHDARLEKALAGRKAEAASMFDSISVNQG